jgi:hypothetical protein
MLCFNVLNVKPPALSESLGADKYMAVFADSRLLLLPAIFALLCFAYHLKAVMPTPPYPAKNAAIDLSIKCV